MPGTTDTINIISIASGKSEEKKKEEWKLGKREANKIGRFFMRSSAEEIMELVMKEKCKVTISHDEAARSAPNALATFIREIWGYQATEKAIHELIDFMGSYVAQNRRAAVTTDTSIH